MTLLNQQHLSRTKELIFEKGRLLERQLYRYFFENGSRESCLKALLAYQNADGGFGNGIEADLLCPGSSAIGAETALFVLEMLDYSGPDIIIPLLNWLEANQDDSGKILHPPKDFEQYPYQPWWDKEDSDRVLVLAGMLNAWQDNKPKFFEKTRNLSQQGSLPDSLSFYDYPIFVYLARCQQEENKQAFQHLCAKLPTVWQENVEHFPLFSRYWYHAKNYVVL